MQATRPRFPELSTALSTSRVADAVVLCVGFDSTTESEGSDRTFRLPPGQNELIRQIADVNKNTVVVVTAGGNVDMISWLDRVPVLLHAWYPGDQGGRALAQIVFKDYSPSGKLPASFERRWEDNPTFHSYYPAEGEKRVKYSEGIFLGYRHYDRADVKPLFPFGFGLSYTTFPQQLSLPNTGDLREPVTVEFDVKKARKSRRFMFPILASVPRPIKGAERFCESKFEAGREEACEGDTESSCLLFL